MLPNAVAYDPDIDECALVMLAARLTFGGRWVMTQSWAQGLVRRGLGEHCYWEALGRLTEGGLVQRRKAANGRQGHGSVVDDRACLPAAHADHYRHVERAWFDGRLSVKAAAMLIFVRAQADGEAQPWRIRQRFGWSFGTIKSAAEELQKAVLIERFGGAQNPAYRACNSQNPRCKKARFLRTDHHLRTDQSSHTDHLLRKRRYRAALEVHGDGTDGAIGQGSAGTRAVVPAERTEGPPRSRGGEHIPSNGTRGQGEAEDQTATVMAAVAEERQRQTEAALAETEQAIASGDREPWTLATLNMIGAMGVDAPGLVKRYWARTRGQAVDDPNAYLLAMAKDAVAKRTGMTREVLAAIGKDRAVITGTDKGDARAQAERREALACQLGGGDVARGYALLAAIPDNPHRRSGQNGTGVLNGESVRSASVYPANVEPILGVIDETFGDDGWSWDEIAEHLAEELVEIAAGRPSSASSMTINGLALWLAWRGADGQPSKGEGLAKEGNHNFKIRVTGGPYHVRVGVGPLETHHEMHDLLQVLDRRLRADGARPATAVVGASEEGTHR